MKNNVKQHIFFVDDEPKVREVVSKTLEQLAVKVSCFASGAQCLKQLRSQPCDLLITDVKIPTMDGIELLTEAKCIIPLLPILVITGYGNIPMAVRVMKAGASDFIEKPLDREGFLSTVKSLLKPDISDKPSVRKPLTNTELKVLYLILEGKNNKEIAQLRHRSVRTIEDQRYTIMSKLGADNLIELVKKAATMGLFELPTKK